LLPADYLRKQLVLPIRFDRKAVVVGMADPNNVFLIDELKRKTKCDVKVVVTPAAEINRLIEAALRIRPASGLRPQTYATLIALLAVTGLRISEALKLQVADMTSDGLLIRETKFRKTRLTPLHHSAAAGLERYLRRRHPRCRPPMP